MKPEKLDQRVTFQKESRNPDEYGGVSLAWVDVDVNPSVWAGVRPLKGVERFGADRVEAQAGYLFTVRNRADINETHSIVWNGRRFNVRFVRDEAGRPLYKEIETEVGVAV